MIYVQEELTRLRHKELLQEVQQERLARQVQKRRRVAPILRQPLLLLGGALISLGYRLQGRYAAVLSEAQAEYGRTGELKPVMYK